MSMDTIVSCLEQKNLLMTHLLNLTKQIEVQASQEEIVIDEILAKRTDFMKRIDKCNALIQSTINNMESPEKEHLDALIANPNDSICDNETDQNIVALCLKYKELLVRTVEIDTKANELMQQRHEEIKNKLNSIRKKVIKA